MTERTCATEGCTRPCRYKELCDTCKRREYRQNRERVLCAWPEGCDALSAIGGYCQPHYARFRSFGLPGIESALLLRGACKEDDCDEPVVALGWCGNHYWHWRKHGDPHGGPGRKPPVIRKYTLNEAFFDEVATEVQAYWLGFITADGCIPRKSSYTMSLSLMESDREHLARMHADMGSNMPVRIDRRRQAYANINSRQFIEALGRLGITGRKSKTVEPWSGPADLMPHYWRGLFDGDGCIGCYLKKKRYPSWGLTQVGSPACIEAYATWVRAICGTRVSPIRLSCGIWQFAVSGTWMTQKLAVALYGNATVALPRKLALAEKLMSADFAAMYGSRSRPRR